LSEGGHKNGGDVTPKEKLKDRVCMPRWFPPASAGAKIHKHLEPAVEEHERLKRAVETLLFEMDPVKFHDIGIALDNAERKLGIKLDGPQAELAALAEELKVRLHAVKCVVNSILDQKLGPDFEHYNKSHDTAVGRACHRIFKENGVKEKLRSLEEKAWTVFAYCRTLEECVSTANVLASGSTDFCFSQCPERNGPQCRIDPYTDTKGRQRIRFVLEPVKRQQRSPVSFDDSNQAMIPPSCPIF
jgi:hypothetical protein